MPKGHQLVVALGASAGGLDAFKSFFAHMPADSGMSFIVVQHLSPGHTSILPSLVQASTSMSGVVMTFMDVTGRKPAAKSRKKRSGG